jgi:hypothetical protein
MDKETKKTDGEEKKRGKGYFYFGMFIIFISFSIPILGACVITTQSGCIFTWSHIANVFGAVLMVIGYFRIWGKN